MVPGGAMIIGESMSDMTLVLHQSVAINAKGGDFLYMVVIDVNQATPKYAPTFVN